MTSDIHVLNWIDVEKKPLKFSFNVCPINAEQEKTSNKGELNQFVAIF
jgi:hypothetical protein